MGLVDYFGRLSFIVSALSLLTLLGLGLFAAVLAFEASLRTALQRELRLAADQVNVRLFTINEELQSLSSTALVINSMLDPEGRLAYLPSFIADHPLARESGFHLRLVNVNNEVIEGSVPRETSITELLGEESIESLGFDNELSSTRDLLNSASLELLLQPQLVVIYNKTKSPFIVLRHPVVVPLENQAAGAVDLIFPAQKLLASLSALPPGRFWRLTSDAFAIEVPASPSSNAGAQGKTRKDTWQELVGLQVPNAQWETSLQGLSLALVETNNPMIEAVKALLPFALFTFGVGLFTSWLLARRFARRAAQPIVQLTRSVEVISSRGLSESTVVIDNKAPWEVVVLQQRFEDMIRQLRHSQDQLEVIVDQRTRALVRAQQEIADRSQRMGEILRLSPDGFLEILASGRVGFVNAAFEAMTGLTSADLLGISQDELETLLLRLESAGSTSPILPSTSVFYEVLRAPSPESTEVGLRVVKVGLPWRRVLAVAAFQSEYGSRLLFLRDVTREADVDQMKADFLSMAAHELRTPLASIQGFAELLLRRGSSEESSWRDGLETILRHSAAMRELINDLLALAREEARVGLDHVMQVRSLTPVIRRVAADFRHPDDPRMLVMRLDDHLPPARFDADRIGQVLVNLLSNSHKYSPKGSAIELATVVREAGEADTGWVGFRVKDYGIGMTPEEQSRLFERFFRADPHGEIPGTGLGMALVQEIVKQHNGRLDVHSTKGKGTAITVLLPQLVPDWHTSPLANARLKK